MPYHYAIFRNKSSLFMKHFFYIITTILLTSQTAFAQGLRFYGAEQPIDERTSYNVFDNRQPVFSGCFDIEFDISFFPDREIGYIIRIKNETSNTVYNLFYDAQGPEIKFRFNEEGKSILINARIDKHQTEDRQWDRMKISFDLVGDSIKLDFNGHVFAAHCADLPDRYSPVIVFGRSEHIIDVPSFAIKDLSVGNDEKRFSFRFRENEGSRVHEANGRLLGRVDNPVWMINDAYHWRFVTSLKAATVAGANYNRNKKEIYYFTRDSLTIYNVRSGDVRTQPFSERCPVELFLGMNFIDSQDNRLYAYEVYDPEPSGKPMVAALDLDNYRWSVESNQTLPTQLHHHSAYFDPDTRRYTIFGGFGNMYFSNGFYSFDLDTKQWEQLESLTGDVIFPRYFSSVGYRKENNSVYIFGGMGNQSGEQVVGRNYLYDLYQVDLTTGKVAKLWEIPWDNHKMVPVRSMLMPDGEYFYTLCYPEHFSDSFLQLYRFSLHDGSFEILGDSIPIRSDKIKTNANIYLDDQLNRLYTIVQEFDQEDVASELKIYSLVFPPISKEDLVRSGELSACVKILLGVLLAALAVVVGLIVYRRRRRPGSSGEDKQESVQDLSKEVAKPNSIWLFGDFTAYDRKSRDITYMFSTRLKEAFCLILQYSTEEGISSQLLSSLLWPDKPQDKVKNSRGVTINHLRKVLSEFDGVELIYDKGCFRLVQSPAFFCDYTRCLDIISGSMPDSDKEELVGILSRGKFLKFLEQPLFDSFKEKVEHKLIPVILQEMERSFEQEAYQTTLDLAEAMFNIDPMNDDALAYQTRSLLKLKSNDEALIKYQSFVIKYRKAMGHDYPIPFKKLI